MGLHELQLDLHSPWSDPDKWLLPNHLILEPTVTPSWTSTRQAVGVLYPDLSGAMRTFRLTGGYNSWSEKKHRRGRGTDLRVWTPLNKLGGGSKVDIKIRRWEGVREWGNRWMLASPGPWRLGVAVALRSRSPQTAAELARSGSIRFYSILSLSLSVYYSIRPILPGQSGWGVPNNVQQVRSLGLDLGLGPTGYTIFINDND